MFTRQFMIILVIFMFFLFIYFLTTGNPDYMFTDGRHEALPDIRGFTDSRTNSPVQLLNSSTRLSGEPSENRSVMSKDYSKSPYIGYKNKVYDVELSRFEKSSPVRQKFVFNPNNRKFGSIGERLCCKIMEEYLGREVKVGIRPDFLKNPKTKRNLELDVYDPITKTAIEYNGIQHYKYVSKFHKTAEDFEKQVERDLLKIELCEKEGVNLLSVSYTVDSGKRINGVWKSVSVPEYVREQRLNVYITQFLSDNITN